jgi:folate-binding protein YgfZ
VTDASPPLPPPPPPPPTVTRLNPGAVPVEVVDHLRADAVVAKADVGVVDLAGPGAITCFQGLLTNDIEEPGDACFVYGALLTAKGMIVVDGWASRLGSRIRYTVPTEGRQRALDIFHRSVPPRLAHAVDRTGDSVVLRVAGAHAVAIAGAAGFPVPPHTGRVIEATTGDVSVEVARATEQAPFALQITAPAEQEEAVVERLVRRGAVRAEPPVLELARVLAGWPRLASEVDDKTIPQEVRFDEIGGVSYTKGCYTGQETVSRLHFRGHANRQLRGLLFEIDPPAPPADGWSSVMEAERDVGRVTSVAWLPDGGGSLLGRWVGLAILRREVLPGVQVRAAGREARVVDLPFSVRNVGPA